MRRRVRKSLSGIDSVPCSLKVSQKPANSHDLQASWLWGQRVRDTHQLLVAFGFGDLQDQLGDLLQVHAARLRLAQYRRMRSACSALCAGVKVRPRFFLTESTVLFMMNSGAAIEFFDGRPSLFVGDPWSASIA